MVSRVSSARLSSRLAVFTSSNSSADIAYLVCFLAFSKTSEFAAVCLVVAVAGVFNVVVLEDTDVLIGVGRLVWLDDEVVFEAGVGAIAKYDMGRAEAEVAVG